jgi:hypothetical protein
VPNSNSNHGSKQYEKTGPQMNTDAHRYKNGMTNAKLDAIGEIVVLEITA